MQLETTRFGVVEVDEMSTIDVPSGVPGFADMRRVTLLGAGAMPGVPATTDQNSMFWMQDVDDGARAFLCIDPWMTFPDYDVEIDEKALEIQDNNNVCVLALVTVNRTEGEATMSANLRAPIVIDLGTRRAHQLILSDKTWPLDATFATTAHADATQLSVV
ncbi:MAG TPA: flagellar assembly protein FliW [Ilumatobacteraceae bacterium]|nr:flagellar assembly protein FliW [Ilumatobacteraceae bacterium]